MAAALKVIDRLDAPNPDNVIYIVEVSSGGSSARVRKSYGEFREYDDYCRQTDPSILVQLPGGASRFGDPKSKMLQYLQSMVELPNMMPILSEFLGVSESLFRGASNGSGGGGGGNHSSGSAGSGPRGPGPAGRGPPPVAPKPRGIGGGMGGGLPPAAPPPGGNTYNRPKAAPSDADSDSSGSGYDSAAFEEYVPPVSRPTAAGAGIEMGGPPYTPRSSPASPNGVPPAAPGKPSGIGGGRPPPNDDRSMKKLIIEALTAAQQAARHLLTKPPSAQDETDVASTMSATIHQYIDPEELHRWVQSHLTDSDVCTAFDKTTETMNSVEDQIVRRQQQAPPVVAPRPGRPMTSPRSGMTRGSGGYGRGGRISPMPTSSSMRGGFGGRGRGTPSPSSSPPPMGMGMSRTPPPSMGGRGSPRYGGGPPSGGFRGGPPGRVTPSRATLTSGPPGRGGFGGPPGGRGGYGGGMPNGGRGRGFGGHPGGGGSVGSAAGRGFAGGRGGGFGMGGSMRGGGFGGGGGRGGGGFNQHNPQQHNGGFNASQSSPNLFNNNNSMTRNQSPTSASNHSSDDAKSDAGSTNGRSVKGGYQKTGVPYIDVYRGRKRRRKWSLSSPLLRMYLSQQHQKNLMKLMRNKPDPRFVFASHAVKVNKKFKKQPRILALTSSNLYNIDATADSINREIPLENIDSVSLSTKADNWLVVHVPSEYDYLFLCNHKTEFLMELRKQMKKLKKNLKLKFAKEIPYRLKSSHVHQITFPEQQNEVRNQKLAQEFTVNQLTNIEIILANRLHDDLLATDDEIMEFARKITSAVEQDQMGR